MLDVLISKSIEQRAEDNTDDIIPLLTSTMLSKILCFLKDDLSNKHAITLNQVFISEGNEGVLKIIRENTWN